MAHKSFRTSIAIDAAPDRVWAILVNAADYPRWNSTVDSVAGRIGPGERVTVHAKISPGRAFPVRVSEFVANRRMVWTGGMPLGLFKGERVFTLAPRGSGTDFAMEEQFTGLMAPLIGRSIPDLQPAFDAFARDLKRAAEVTPAAAASASPRGQATSGPSGAAAPAPVPPGIVQLSAPDLKAMIDDGHEFQFIDVRTPQERAIARIEGAELLDQAKHDQLMTLDRDTPLVFQCHHGGRSQSAAEYFHAAGFQKVFNLRGGIDAWSQQVDPTIPRY